MERTRTVTWRDPAGGARAAVTLTGIEYLRAMARGDAPASPFSFIPHVVPTLQLQVNYVRPVTIETGKLFCSGEVIYLGKRSATAGGRLTDAAGRLYAHATGTFMILGPEDREGR